MCFFDINAEGEGGSWLEVAKFLGRILRRGGGDCMGSTLVCCCSPVWCTVQP